MQILKKEFDSKKANSNTTATDATVSQQQQKQQQQQEDVSVSASTTGQETGQKVEHMTQVMEVMAGKIVMDANTLVQHLQAEPSRP